MGKTFATFLWGVEGETGSYGVKSWGVARSSELVTTNMLHWACGEAPATRQIVVTLVRP